jgi:hypothetical protein
MSEAICGITRKTRISWSLSSGAHSRDPLAHPGYRYARLVLTRPHTPIAAINSEISAL